MNTVLLRFLENKDHYDILPEKCSGIALNLHSASMKILFLFLCAGHEYPFGIKMSHIRDTLPQMQGSKDCACPLDLQGAFLIEQLPRELQCQFILKPSRLASGHQLNELSQKPFKRKRSIINWAFWRGTGAPLDNAPPSPTSPSSGKLFGLSLSTICENDNLPKPVLFRYKESSVEGQGRKTLKIMEITGTIDWLGNMAGERGRGAAQSSFPVVGHQGKKSHKDMLSFLYQEGPFTRGIFRRSANAKSCRELKEKLDSGAEVHLLCESVFVTASVFKDFLRNIPGSIFSSQLCEQWVSLMDEGNCEEKIKRICRLMEQLPRANLVLLRYLFGVLHSIEKQSEDNQMTAFNLAVCIAPSLLWPPAPASPGTEGEFTKKVSVLIQFLIENCSRIFGEDIASIFADIVPKNDNREDGSDLSSFHLNDSSYDSLENELNDCTDSSFNNLIKKRGQENRSRDSVLTLSDCDLDPPETEDTQIKLPAKSQPVSISAGFRHKSPSREHSENESLCSITSGYSSTALSDVLKSSRRHRRCSEPTIGLLASKFTPVSGFHESAVRKASCDAVLSHTDEDCLKQLRSLQVEGQKLINQSLVMGIDVGKNVPESHSSEKKDTSNRLLPPPPLRLNISSRTSCSSLSSPGTSPSGSSMSSLDSAFSQFSDYSVFTPTETSSPLDCTFHPPRKYGELSPDISPFSGIHLGSGAGSFPSQTTSSHSSNLGSVKKESLEWPPHKSAVTLHPSTWLKSGASTMKNWTLRKRERASKQEEKRRNSTKITVEIETCPSDVSESYLYQGQCPGTENPAATGGVNATSLNQESSSSQGAGQLSGLPFCPAEVKDKRLKALELLAEQSKEEEEEESSSVFPSHKRQPSSTNPSAKHKLKPDAAFSSQYQHLTKGNVSESVISSEAGVGDSKDDKFLSSAESKFASVNSKRDFCGSSEFAKAEGKLVFRSSSSTKPEDGAVPDKTEWMKKLCADPKFEEIDQKFFTEESYV
ncbi:UNVERIFIED_CONTAM: hypothetical protein K2H54_066726 [Gekko kuhli]